MEKYNYIRSKLTTAELLAGLAEEAAELAQAALKLRRVLDGSNPTPVNKEEAYTALLEEVADVRLYEDVLWLHWETLALQTRRREKVRRWAERLREREGG